MGIIIYVTYPNLKVAQKIVNHLLKKRLIACANFFPIKSAYWWQSKIQNDKEIATFLKTTDKNWLKIKKEIERLHPYKVPVIEKIKGEANKKYENWLRKVTK